MSEISQLIVRMAQDNPGWGYTRIKGALANLNHRVGRGTIANVLKRSGIEPAPERAIIGVLSDVLRLVVLFLRSSSAIRAENLVLRKQLGSYIERGVKPRRVDHATRVGLALFSKLFDWRDAVVVVKPSTVLRWHRLGWRLF